LYKPRLYLDSCCFNRPFDDLSYDKVRFECEAVLDILSNCVAGMLDVFRSDVLTDELCRITRFILQVQSMVMQLFFSLQITG